MENKGHERGASLLLTLTSFKQHTQLLTNTTSRFSLHISKVIRMMESRTKTCRGKQEWTVTVMWSQKPLANVNIAASLLLTTTGYLQAILQLSTTNAQREGDIPSKCAILYTWHTRNKPGLDGIKQFALESLTDGVKLTLHTHQKGTTWLQLRQIHGEQNWYTSSVLLVDHTQWVSLWENRWGSNKSWRKTSKLIP